MAFFIYFFFGLRNHILFFFPLPNPKNAFFHFSWPLVILEFKKKNLQHLAVPWNSHCQKVSSYTTRFLAVPLFALCSEYIALYCPTDIGVSFRPTKQNIFGNKENVERGNF